MAHTGSCFSGFGRERGSCHCDQFDETLGIGWWKDRDASVKGKGRQKVKEVVVDWRGYK
jgi:hypothetical protein